MKNRRLPKTFDEFVGAFPDVGRAWEALGKAARSGPLGAQACELVKLGIAIGARSEGAVHSATRKALAAGADRDELFQVALLATSTIGIPNAVAAFTWIRDIAGPPARPSRARARRARA
jgi:alkylhydroperoxidase/carboxymuconolactone decarboxylase family protein YurZ